MLLVASYTTSPPATYAVASYSTPLPAAYAAASYTSPQSVVCAEVSNTTPQPSGPVTQPAANQCSTVSHLKVRTGFGASRHSSLSLYDTVILRFSSLKEKTVVYSP